MGHRGEELAVEHLKAQGYRIIERNVRSRMGEIDLVARDGKFLCFVEVRSRSSTRFGWPEESVTALKRLRLKRLAEGYLQRFRGPAGPVRFDVLSLLLDPAGAPARIRLIKGAFEAG